MNEEEPMTFTRVAGFVLATVLLLPVAARAHEGHMHKVLGTVSSVQGQHVMIKTTDGKDVMVMLDNKTQVTRGKDKLDASALKAGERVSVDYMEEKGMMMAHAVKLGAAASAKK
jgi:hypothetical protein